MPDQAGGYAVHCGPDLNSDPAGAGSEVMHRMAERYVALICRTGEDISMQLRERKHKGYEGG